MTKKIVFALALALVIVGIAAPSASAACPAPKVASTYNSVTGAFVNFTTTVSNGTLTAQVWSGSTDFTGTCNIATANGAGNTYLYFTDPTHVGFNYNLGDACVPGACPTGNLTLKVINTGLGSEQEFIANGGPECSGAGCGPAFDFSTITNLTMVSKAHRPRVSASSRAAGTVSIFADPAAGYAGNLDTVNCVLRSAVGSSQPGSSVANWPTVLNTSPAANGVCPALTGVTIDCTGGVDRWIAYQYSNPNGADLNVGDPVRIGCNPALADPKPKLTPKKPVIDNKSN